MFLIPTLSTIVDRGQFLLQGSAKYLSMDFQLYNLGAVNSKGSVLMWKILNQSTNYTLYSYPNPFGNSLTGKVRTNIWNINLPSGNIIVFDNSTIYSYNLTSITFLPIYTNPTNITIINSCYGSNISELFILVYNSSIPGYQVLYYLSSVLNDRSLSVQASSVNNKMIYQNNLLYISFQTGIVILSGDISLTSLKMINFTSTLVNYVDMTVDALSFGYSYNNTVFILSTADFSVLWQTTLSQMITGVKIISCYLFVYANPYIY